MSHHLQCKPAFGHALQHRTEDGFPLIKVSEIRELALRSHDLITCSLLVSDPVRQHKRRQRAQARQHQGGRLRNRGRCGNCDGGVLKRVKVSFATADIIRCRIIKR